MSTGASAQLALLVRRYRLAAGLSQEDLSERTGLSVRTISDFERGLRVAPRPESIRMLADGLELTDGERASLIAAVRPELAMDTPERPNELGTFGALPSTSGTLIGREREIADLVGMLSDGTTRLVTLTGPGGVGKTRLALAVAREAAPEFSGGVAFVALAAVRDPRLVMPTIARSLGVPETSDRPLIERVRGYLANAASLLVLDNMEQVIDSAADVAVLLNTVPDLSVLVTSRGPLRLSGEYSFLVPALRLSESGDSQPIEAVAGSEAGQLFIDRARMAQPGFSLTEANAPAIVEICHRLDGLPLAIELAAARIPLLPPTALLARMERRLPLLTGGARDLPQRLQTMRAAIAWSYDLLSPEEQSAFWRLAVFSGGFTLEAAETVIAAGEEDADAAVPLDHIAVLVEQGLLWQVEQPDGDARFGMLETIREFGLEQLEASGEEDAVRHSHAAWYLALAEAFDAAGPSAAIGALDRLERELPNVRIALARAEQESDALVGLQLAQSLFFLWHIRSHRAEGRDWLERALARDPDTRSAARAGALEALGLIEHNLGNAELGVKYLEEGLSLARELGDRRSIVFALLQLADFAVHAGENEQGRLLLIEAETWGEHPEDRFDVPGYVLIGRGVLHRRNGDLPQASKCFADAHARLGHLGATYLKAIAGEFLGLVLCDCGDYARAAACYREALIDWREIGTRESLVDWLAMVATLAEAAGEPAHARRWFGAVEAQEEVLGFNFPLPERNEFDRIATSVRAGPADPEWAAGRQLSLDQVTDEAASWLEISSQSKLGH